MGTCSSRRRHDCGYTRVISGRIVERAEVEMGRCTMCSSEGGRRRRRRRRRCTAAALSRSTRCKMLQTMRWRLLPDEDGLCGHKHEEVARVKAMPVRTGHLISHDGVPSTDNNRTMHFACACTGRCLSVQCLGQELFLVHPRPFHLIHNGHQTKGTHMCCISSNPRPIEARNPHHQHEIRGPSPCPSKKNYSTHLKIQ